MAATLTLQIEEIRDSLTRGDFASEAQISRSVVMRLLITLGWNVWDPKVVIPEFPIKTESPTKILKVDYVLCHPPGKPSVLIEVKDVGKANAQGEEQLFDYCFRQGVPLAVLTDGRSWGFFFPAGQGSYQERRFATVDLVDDDAAEGAERISRYLAFEAVRAGEAHRRAHDDYYAFRQQSEAAANFEAVWAELLHEPPEVLKDWFCEEVERTSGVRPDLRRVEEFIRGQGSKSSPRRSQTVKTSEVPTEPTLEHSQAVSESPKGRQGKEFSFTFRGQTEWFRNGKELLVGVFERLLEKDAQFCEKLEPHLKGRKRQYLARDQYALYPDDPKLAKTQSASLSGGWWLGTNSSTSTKRNQIQIACRVAGIEFGKDLIVNLGE